MRTVLRRVEEMNIRFGSQGNLAPDLDIQVDGRMFLHFFCHKLLEPFVRLLFQHLVKKPGGQLEFLELFKHLQIVLIHVELLLGFSSGHIDLGW